MSASRRLSNRCRPLLLLLAALSPAGARANSISYAPAQYYGAELLSGNLQSPTGLWVAAPQDPLAYIYGYIPAIEQGGAPYFGSANFDPIPVLLASPAIGLQELSLALGNTPLPAGGAVLDLSAAVAAFESLSPAPPNPASASQVSVPEPRTLWLAIAVGIGITGLYRRRRKALVQIKQSFNGKLFRTE